MRGATTPVSGEDGSASSDSGGERIKVGFTGFGQTKDAKARTVRFRLGNTSRQAIVSVRLVLRYRSRAGAPLGSFPLNIVRRIRPGETVAESTELLGQTGPPEEVAKVELVVRALSYADGTHWRAAK